MCCRVLEPNHLLSVSLSGLKSQTPDFMRSGNEGDHASPSPGLSSSEEEDEKEEEEEEEDDEEEEQTPPSVSGNPTRLH